MGNLKFRTLMLITSNWYRTMLNFYLPFLCRVLAAILKMADVLKILKMQNCSSNGDLSLCQNLCLYHYPAELPHYYDQICWSLVLINRWGRDRYRIRAYLLSPVGYDPLYSCIHGICIKKPIIFC
jgi:hypothetical protein